MGKLAGWEPNNFFYHLNADEKMITQYIIIFWTLACVWGFFFSLNNLFMIQNMIENIGPKDIAAVVMIIMWLSLWSFIVVPVALIGILFKKSSADDESPTALRRGSRHR